MEYTHNLLIPTEEKNKMNLTKDKKEYFKKYYQEHKDAYKNSANRYTKCLLCNCSVQTKAVKAHLETLKHIKNITVFKNQNNYNDI
jgi:hypothetical protein